MSTSYQTLMKLCISCLARREYSSAELRQKMQAHPEDLQCQVLDALVEKGLQSDERFVEMWVRNRMERGKGPLLIRQELDAKGIAQSIANEALEAVSESQWYDVCLAAYQKKYSTDCQDIKERQKRLRFLQSRGFSFSLSQSVLSEAY